jgi:hypothetical protein
MPRRLPACNELVLWPPRPDFHTTDRDAIRRLNEGDGIRIGRSLHPQDAVCVSGGQLAGQQLALFELLQTGPDHRALAGAKCGLQFITGQFDKRRQVLNGGTRHGWVLVNKG